MKTYLVRNKTNDFIYGSKVKMASSFGQRLLGLMFARGLEDDTGLMIDPCNSIHTFFMRFDIDVLFLDKDDKVVGIHKRVRPWRMTRIYWSAKKVLELPPGKVPDSTKKGDELEVICSS